MQSTKPAILCTGPVDHSVIDLAGAKNVDIDVLPLTEISSALSQSILEEIEEIAGKKAVVVFTSSNAIRPVTKILNGRKPDWTIYCIGHTTYELAKEYFGANAIRQTASTAAGLAKKVIADYSTGEVIFFCGNLRRNELPAALAEKNIAVKEIIVYQTTLAPKTITKEYDAILFFSPSSAQSFFMTNTLPVKTVLFVMGHTTAEEIKKYSNNRIITGDEPVKNKLVNKVVDFVREKFSEIE